MRTQPLVSAKGILFSIHDQHPIEEISCKRPNVELVCPSQASFIVWLYVSEFTNPYTSSVFNHVFASAKAPSYRHLNKPRGLNPERFAGSSFAGESARLATYHACDRRRVGLASEAPKVDLVRRCREVFEPEPWRAVRCRSEGVAAGRKQSESAPAGVPDEPL